jgi:ribosome recycling factor
MTPSPITLNFHTSNTEAFLVCIRSSYSLASSLETKKTPNMQVHALALSLFAIISAASGFVPNLNRAPFVGSFALFGEAVDEFAMDAEDRMGKSIENVIQNMGTVRTGRASPAMLDRVKCDYYGTETPISQMATISTPSAQQLTVDPYDKSVLADIERAIMEAEMGLTPQNDGNIIRLNIPALTEDRRKEMQKQCKAIGEEGKVAIRNIRRSFLESVKKLEKNGDISVDESKDGSDEIQKLTDKTVKSIDDIVARKEKEVMTV